MSPRPDLSGASDQDIVALALEGRGEAYHELVRRYRDRVHTLIYRIVGTHARADDLTQETFDRIFKKLHRYRPERPFAPWIRTIAHNIAVDYVRCRPADAASAPTRVTSGYIDLYGIAAPTPSDTPTPDPEVRRSAAALEQALRGLKPQVRRCVILREVQGRSYAEIARIMHLPIGTVGTYIHRGRKQLKKMLAPFLDSSRSDSARTPV